MDEEYIRFRKRILAKKSLNWRLLSGSFYERPLHHILEDVTDIDYLIWPEDVCAIPPGYNIPPFLNCRSTILTVHTKRVHVGFAKLQMSNENRKFYERPGTPHEIMVLRDDWRMMAKGCSVQKTTDWILNNEGRRIYEDLCQCDSSWKQMTQIKIDYVEAIYCPYWPPEVTEWVKRKRENGWPTREDIEKIAKGGCHFVAKPHQNNPNDSTEWRFSFSSAELILIHSMTDVQKHIYHILRLIKKEVVKSCGGEDLTILCTYFFKTLMLWACEEKSKEFWTEENLENSFGELLLQLIEWLIERRIPNYFIPSNNMIDYLSDDADLSQEISFLLHQKERCISSLLKLSPMNFLTEDVLFLIPRNLCSHMQLSLVFLNACNPLDPKMFARIFNHLVRSEQFLSELNYLYLGISAHQRLMTLPQHFRSRIFARNAFSAASENFLLATKFIDLRSSSTSVNLHDSVIDIFRKFLMTDKSIKTIQPVENQRERTQINYHFEMFRIIFERAAEKVNKFLPPPVFAVAAAYRANFLFNVPKNYIAVIKQCEEVKSWISIAKGSSTAQFNTGFPALPFLVTTEWSVIFYKHFQAVFGFVTLFRKIFRQCCNCGFALNCEDERSVVLRLNALVYLDYVRYRSLKKLGIVRLPFEYNRPISANVLRVNSVLDKEEDFTDFSRIFLYAAKTAAKK